MYSLQHHVIVSKKPITSDYAFKVRSWLRNLFALILVL